MVFISKIPTTWSASSVTCWIVSLWEMEVMLQHNLAWPSSKSKAELVIVLILDSSLRRFLLYFQNHHFSGQLVQILLQCQVSEASKDSEASEPRKHSYFLCAVREQVTANWAGWLAYLSSSVLCKLFLGQQVWGWQCRENIDAVNTLQRLRISVFIGLVLNLSHKRIITEIIRFK